MSFHEPFFAWAKEQGVAWTGLDFESVPGCGIGVKATRGLKKGETILSVPSHAYRTLDTLSPQVAKALPGLSLQARLAADLSLDDSAGFKKWSAVFPAFEEVKASYPFFWPRDLQELLPSRAKHMVDGQIRRYTKEWAVVSDNFPKLRQELFQYYWIIVNSRTFYLRTPSMEELEPDDLLCLMPVADLFNHADRGIDTTIKDDVYEWTADRDYAQGEDVMLCYAEESNDYLFAEYGFVPDVNKWDNVSLDDMILPRLTEDQKATLNTREYYGKYTINATTLGCWRTQVALRLTCCTQGNWEGFVRGAHDGALSQAKVDKMLLSMLRDYQETVFESMKKSRELKADPEGRKDVLVRRWSQTQDNVVAVIMTLQKKLRKS